jgi:hypothetical protein
MIPFTTPPNRKRCLLCCCIIAWMLSLITKAERHSERVFRHPERVSGEVNSIVVWNYDYAHICLHFEVLCLKFVRHGSWP